MFERQASGLASAEAGRGAAQEAMSVDIRADAAKYYDLLDFPNDIPFYKARVPSPQARALELGCGTGRVLLPLAGMCGYIHGLDKCEAMLAVCREKLKAAGIPPEKARVEQADIARFDLGRTFDWIIAPYRVFQNLETDGEIEGFFKCVRAHLAPGASCVLNVFRTYERERLFQEWPRQEEALFHAKVAGNRRVMFYERRPRIDKEKLILYPELVCRAYEGEALTEEAVLKIAMRCYYPQPFEDLIVSYGFRVIGRWGGYGGEPYGQGPELVVQFAKEESESQTERRRNGHGN